jgi:hypothetical protein
MHQLDLVKDQGGIGGCYPVGQGFGTNIDAARSPVGERRIQPKVMALAPLGPGDDRLPTQHRPDRDGIAPY